MVKLLFYSMLYYGLFIAFKPSFIAIKDVLKSLWNSFVEWDKKRIKNRMDAYHRGEGNYEYYNPDKTTEGNG